MLSADGTTHLPNLHRLTVPTPYSVGDVNIYLFEPALPGEPLALLDTGPNWEPSETAVQAGLAALGYSARDLGLILISHPHPDHYGLASALVAESGAKLLAHLHSHAILASAGRNSHQASAFYREWFTRNGVPPSAQEAMSQAQASTHHFAQPVQPDAFLGEGDRISLGGQVWQVLATPGHSGGMICLYQPADGTLLSSDHLIDDISSNPVVEPPPDETAERPRRLLQYIQQLERIAALGPNIAYSGHGRPIRDPVGLVQKRVAFHERRAAQVLEHLGNGPASLYELSCQVFGTALPAVHQFLALSEVQGHLDLLEASGQAGCIPDGAGCCWVATPRE